MATLAMLLAVLLSPALGQGRSPQTRPTPPPHVWSRPRVTPRSALPIARGPVVFVDPTKACPKGKGGPIRVGSSLGDPPLLDYVEPGMPLRDESGMVIVEAEIGADGKVTRAKPLREAPGLTEPTVDAIGKWRYARACLGGQPVPLIITIALRYGASDLR